MAEKYHLNYMEVSAKCNTKIDEMFYNLTKEIKGKLDEEGKNELDQLSRTITLNASYAGKKLVKEVGNEEGKSSCRC